jgi:hypothetical protein
MICYTYYTFTNIALQHRSFPELCSGIGNTGENSWREPALPVKICDEIFLFTKLHYECFPRNEQAPGAQANGCIITAGGRKIMKNILSGTDTIAVSVRHWYYFRCGVFRFFG